MILLRRTILALVALSALIALGALGWRGNLLDVRARPPFGSVATAFDAPPPYPGYAWTRDGRQVSEFEFETIAGPDHCGWQSATMLFIAWPPGTVAATGPQARQYIRDPQGLLAGRYLQPFERGVRLPSDAMPTGYRLGAIEVYLSASDDDRWIYLVSPADTERWPRSDPLTLCA